MDTRLLEQATAARDQWDELQRQSAEARSRFHEAVLSLHESGATLREIAAALHLSHQRVHQIVGGGGFWARLGAGARRPSRGPGRCSFCGTGHLEARRLIAGPGVWICDRCVGAAEHVAGGGAARDGLSEVTVEDRRCGFCGKRRRNVRGMATAGAVTICADCLALCDEILTGAGAG